MIPDVFGFVQWLVIVVALQRLAELALARCNTRRLLAQGGIEVGAGHYPAIIAIHALWLAACFAFIPSEARANIPLLVTFIALQACRIWVIASLGEYWTTRVISLPGRALVRRGPYCFVRHPNYIVVALEIACLPLMFGAWPIAVLFSVVNGLILFWRIRVEDEALSSRREVKTH
jgi:methyltransferase